MINISNYGLKEIWGKRKFLKEIILNNNHKKWSKTTSNDDWQQRILQYPKWKHRQGTLEILEGLVNDTLRRQF